MNYREKFIARCVKLTLNQTLVKINSDKILEVASNIAVNMLLHAIHEQECPQRIIFDLYSDETEKYFLEKRDECLVCGSQNIEKF